MANRRFPQAAFVHAKIRDAYFERWHREWPEDDKFLTELIREARKDCPESPLEATLDTMRECHEFEATA